MNYRNRWNEFGELLKVLGVTFVSVWVFGFMFVFFA